jgi:hypothetical protein
LAESFWKHKLAESANLCFQSCDFTHPFATTGSIRLPVVRENSNILMFQNWQQNENGSNRLPKVQFGSNRLPEVQVSAKPLFVGSIPTAAFNLFNNL